MTMPIVTIAAQCDGWRITIGDKEYSWDHNDCDLGVVQLAKLFQDLGYTVVEEEEF